MSKSHNKKRNCALLYEFLVTAISRSLVEGDKKGSSVALKVLKRHFKPGTELYKEFRLINALLKARVSSTAVAASVLAEAKTAARSHDVRELDRQKSLLIRSVNHRISDPNFFDQPVADYRMYATVQTLVNDWRDPGADLSRIASYEDALVNHLIREGEVDSQSAILGDDSPGTSRLLMKVMMKKLNEKYSGVLNGDQKELIRAYAFSTANSDPASLRLKLSEVRDRLVCSIDSFLTANPGERYVGKKLADVRSVLVSESLEHVDDATVTRFMLYTKLSTELEVSDDA